MHKFILPLAAAGALTLGGCAGNYAGEGALAGAAVGAAAGAAAGYFVDKDGRCGGYDRRGRLDYDCYGTRGYPVRP